MTQTIPLQEMIPGFGQVVFYLGTKDGQWYVGEGKHFAGAPVPESFTVSATPACFGSEAEALKHIGCLMSQM